MPFISIPHCVEVTIKIDINGKVIVNRHYCFKTDETGITSTDCVDCANAVYNAYVNGWAARMSDQGSIVAVDGRDAEEQEGAFGSTDETLPFVGTDIADAMPNNVALVVTLNTSFTGRSGRGRVYLAGFVEDEVADNKVTSGVITDALATIAEIDDNLILVDFRHRLVSIWHNGVQRNPVISRNIPSLTANQRVDTQRRRLPTV